MHFALKGGLLLKRMQNTGSTFIIYLDNAPSKKKPVQKPLILLILFQSSGPNPPIGTPPNSAPYHDLAPHVNTEIGNRYTFSQVSLISKDFVSP